MGSTLEISKSFIRCQFYIILIYVTCLYSICYIRIRFITAGVKDHVSFGMQSHQHPFTIRYEVTDVTILANLHQIKLRKIQNKIIDEAFVSAKSPTLGINL